MDIINILQYLVLALVCLSLTSLQVKPKSFWDRKPCCFPLFNVMLPSTQWRGSVCVSHSIILFSLKQN